jgi:hypothetical protein
MRRHVSAHPATHPVSIDAPGRLFLPTIVLSGMSTPTRGAPPSSSVAFSTANTTDITRMTTLPAAASANKLPGTTVSVLVVLSNDSISDAAVSVSAIAS